MEAMPGAQKRRPGDLAKKDVNLLTPGRIAGETALISSAVAPSRLRGWRSQEMTTVLDWVDDMGNP